MPDLLFSDQMLSEFGWELDEAFFFADPMMQGDGIWDFGQNAATLGSNP
jgi:hypothetical protein